HDPLNVHDLVHDELAQRRETGYDVDAAAKLFAETDPADTAALERIYEALTTATRSSGWAYEEPDDLRGILDAMPRPRDLGAVDPGVLDDRILGGWLGRIAGCNVGKPVENGDHWTSEHLRDYLERADAYPLRDYVP